MHMSMCMHMCMCVCMYVHVAHAHAHAHVHAHACRDGRPSGLTLTLTPTPTLTLALALTLTRARAFTLALTLTRRAAYVVVESAYFEGAISLTILVNIVSMTLTYYGESEQHAATLAAFNLCFSAIFAVEAALKIVAYFPRQVRVRMTLTPSRSSSPTPPAVPGGPMEPLRRATCTRLSG